MDIGKSKLDREFIEKIDWAIDLEKHGFTWEIEELVKDYNGFPILIMRNKSHDSWPYRGVSIVGVFGEYAPSIEDALASAKYAVDSHIKEEERRIAKI